MNRFRLFLLGMIPVVALLCTAPASAQDSPDGQFGIQAGTGGFGFQYALSPSMHIGAVAGIGVGTADTYNTNISLFPYVKFLLEGNVNPYFIVGSRINSANSNTDVILEALFGLEYFATENVGLFGDITIFSYDEDPVFGIGGGPNSGLGARAGVEWFFDR